MNVILDAAEVRVLGALVEKELSTPDYYPMTVNALTAACNQKTNRSPVVSFSDEDVERVLDALQRKRLVGTASGAYSRAARYRHALAEVYALDVPELAVLASLMLRGPETVGELRGRTTRMYAFDDLDTVEATLAGLAAREAPLVTRMPRRPGQKEERYAHLFAGEPEAEAEELTPGPYPGDERLEALEAEVAALREQLAALSSAFKAFRQQFE